MDAVDHVVLGAGAVGMGHASVGAELMNPTTGTLASADTEATP
jgi:hypothetical protein